ncbi:MAG: TonB-dependent receptor [Taibaiella sp.]|nr:TonB-dependent receptor [Taibaiella sp.]
MKSIFLSVLSFFTITIHAQEATGIIKGRVMDEEKKPVAGATIYISGYDLIAETDQDGAYELSQVPVGQQTIVIIGPGIAEQKRVFTISENQVITEHFSDLKSNTELEGITVLGLSEVDKINKQAYNVTAIDATKLYNTTLDISHTLDRVSGIRVRENGGVGSNINFSLNGFSGNQVKFFMDGMPMESFGSAFQINNIPVNIAERIEVYKGVVPVWLGSDALGGAINIVTNNKLRNYVDVSYAYGSFNTHRSVLNAAVTSRQGLTLQISAFQNYSDNNYKVTLDVADINTGAYTPNTTVRRFHDRYHNETIVLNAGILGKSWADRLLFGVTLGQTYREIQTGARMVSVFGAWHTRGDILMPTLKYQKNNLFVEGLNLNITANYNFGKEQIIDTLFRRYDWYGNYKEIPGVGGERSRTLYKYGNNIAAATTTLSYQVNDRQSIALNNVISSFDRQGFDELSPNSSRNYIPQKTLKNILGLGYKYDISRKWTASLFAKHLYQDSRTALEASSGGSWNDVELIDQVNKADNWGYGLATSYYILPNLMAKLSYEKSNRLPENHELFGDNINQESNFDLKPESSQNINLGLNYNFGLGEEHRFLLGVSGIYRRATDFIYFRLNNNQAKVIADNLEGVPQSGR